jgi:hypothetical protein
MHGTKTHTLLLGSPAEPEHTATQVTAGGPAGDTAGDTTGDTAGALPSTLLHM